MKIMPGNGLDYAPCPQTVASVQYGIDLVSAVRLLTDQIAKSGLVIAPEGFYPSATEAILGGVRSTEKARPPG